ncbi:hypothetical protein T4B_14591 [Trichinella pseudospiralis]|uniref:Uncharacterized protein n=2 Tax=Trichinella pseudospiralis TaxID=6337 RepID=A0A0V1FKC7_TRIPS|nr:hypothetical protein T4E_845 [Trichinella pseudospiralis]KRY70509.1 hypothetical protein T4A_1111 [Trichinella pseudospiralis]KRY86503.1 hypothetical protein T4D_5185 [Trichinella pseudospiralis]KRZ21376.1 hypothetical protein T4B_14591 [Trichinella pseudospiralis]KRZ36389.1 hypothetical protein T4C_7263 [Trichinella pseudospiralis]
MSVGGILLDNGRCRKDRPGSPRSLLDKHGVLNAR